MEEPPENNFPGGSVLNKEYYSWSDRGLCKEFYLKDPDFFFKTKPHEQEKAKLLCKAACPVRMECLMFAIQNDCLGIWGGTDEKERKRLKRLWFGDQLNDRRFAKRKAISPPVKSLSIDPAFPISALEAS